MSLYEKWELALLKLNGSPVYQPNGDLMIMRGMQAFERQREFEDKMIAKYLG